MLSNSGFDPSTYGSMAHVNPMALLVFVLLFSALVLACLGVMYFVATLLLKREQRNVQTPSAVVPINSTSDIRN